MAEATLRYLPNGRVLSPEILRRLWILFGWKLQVQRAHNFLVGCNLVGSPVPLPAYYDFCKRIYFHIRDVGAAAAVPLIESDRDLFKSWNFSGKILSDLALLQGILISP